MFMTVPAGPERGRGIFTDVLPPHVIQRAIAEAMNAIGRQRANDDVPQRRAILDVETPVADLRLAATRQVVDAGYRRRTPCPRGRRGSR